MTAPDDREALETATEFLSKLIAASDRAEAAGMNEDEIAEAIIDRVLVEEQVRKFLSCNNGRIPRKEALNA